MNKYYQKYTLNNYKQKCITLPIIKRKWRILDKRTSFYPQLYLSNAYKYGEFKWYIEFCHFKDGTMGLYLTFLPFINNINSICVKFKLYLLEVDKIIEKSNTHFDMNNLSIGWNINDKDAIKIIETTKELNIFIHFTIHEVYNNKKDVIPNYISNLSLYSTNYKLPIDCKDIKLKKMYLFSFFVCFYVCNVLCYFFQIYVYVFVCVFILK